MNKHNDDLDLPDMPVEPDPPPPEIVPVVEEPSVTAVAKTYDRTAWIREFGPKPPSAGMRIMDFVIVGLLFCTALVIVQALAWAIFS